MKKAHPVGNGSSTRVRAILQPDGKIVVTGCDREFVVVRYLPSSRWTAIWKKRHC
jgi:hypothetical protein